MPRQSPRKAPIFVLGSFVAACSAKVEHLPRMGESLRAEAFTLEPGGKGLNLMIGSRRLGAEVDGLLAVGDDLFARLAEAALVRADLSIGMLRRCRGATGSGIGFADARGDNCLAIYPGANLALSVEHVRAARHAIGGARLVLAQFEIADEPIAEAFALARTAGVATLLNPSPYRTIGPRILADTSILVLNRVEAAQMALALGKCGGGQHTHEQWAALGDDLLGLGPDVVIVTLGAEGALACRKGQKPVHQSAFLVEPVDSLGAGDAFSAGFAVSLIDAFSFEDCLRRAAACGAMATQKLGVFDALPSRARLEDFLNV